MQSLSVVHSLQSSPDQINAANHVLLTFRNRPDALDLCVQVLSSEQQNDAAVLHFASSCVSDLFRSSSSVSFSRMLLGVLCSRFNRPRHGSLALALQRACGKIVASMTSPEWPCCLQDCLAMLEHRNAVDFLFGVLQYTAEQVEQHLVGKAASLVVGQLQQAAPLVCSLCLNSPPTPASLGALSSWVRIGAMPMDVLVPSGLIERVVSVLISETLSEGAILVLSEVFAAPVVASFRTARSVARTSLSLDIPAQRNLVMQVTRELLRLPGRGRSIAWAALLCDIVRQHPTLVMSPDSELREPLIDFLLSLIGNKESIEMASQSVAVWIRLEEVVSSGGFTGVWTPVFVRVTGLALHSALPRPGVDEDSLRQWRSQLEDLLLSCGQILGLDVFFSGLSRVPLEIVLWAISSVQVLHDGRTPFCLPSIFDALLEVKRPVAPSLALVACNALIRYRGFLRNHLDGRYVSGAAQFCGSCLAVAPAAAAKALLELSQTCGSLLAADLAAIAPFVLRALPGLDAETSALLLSMCGELASNLDETKAAPIVAELLDVVLGQICSGSKSEEQLAGMCLSVVGLAERSDGKCSMVYAQRLERAFARLSELATQCDEVCDVVCALGIASGASGQNLLSSVAALAVRVAASRRNGPSAAAIFMLKALVVSAECNEVVLGAFVEAVRRLFQLFKQRLEQIDAECFVAVFDVGKRAQWNTPWRDALCRAPVNQWLLELIPVCYKLHPSNFKLAGEVAAFEEAFVQHSGASVMGLMKAASPVLASLHLRESIQGNPLGLRFHSGPLFDMLKLFGGACLVLLQTALNGIVPDAKCAGTAKLLANAMQTSDTEFKNVLVDLQLMWRGRPDPEFAKTFSQL